MSAQPVQMGRSGLIVDDEPDVLELLAVLFTDDWRCHEIRVDGDLDGAVRQARDRCPDTIVLDLMFGHRICTEVLPELRRACPHTRIIVFTAGELLARAEGVLGLGANSIRQKVTVSFEQIIDEALAG
jgi:DNA-binding NarL/FixJ family response regulator